MYALASRIAVCLLLLAVVACKHGAPGGSPPQVNLEPNDPRPLFSIEVGDEIEAALIQQKLGLAPLRLEGRTLYFHDGADIRKKLAEFGYVASEADPYRVYERVVRVARRGDEPALRRAGVTLINREPDYWVVRGSLGVLRGLAAAGYVITPIDSSEPRPRAIRVYVRTPEEAQEVERYASIYASGFAPGYDKARQEGRLMVLAAEAFDAAIDTLRGLGYRVELIEEPAKGDRP